MIIERFMHPGWLSNSYLVAEAAGGEAFVVDTWANPDPIVRRARELALSVRWIVNTHFHIDHIGGNESLRAAFGAEVAAHREDAALIDGVDRILEDGDTLTAGGLVARVIHIPGHTAGHLALAIGDPPQLFTGDTLFRRSVGGTVAPGHTDFTDLRRSIMQELLTFPHETIVHPGHTDPTTVGEEWSENPFVRVMRGADPEGEARCEFAGRPARLIVRARDYDGGHKAWVRFDAAVKSPAGASGEPEPAADRSADATVPGSRVRLLADPAGR